ncbi:hypothetical protein [Paractinoplanes brasiliensis]|uniref:Phosphotransferase family enzyme n=1 Tax=Paractinoplanes brasiliensis TaxID=52695 RepID=A0A4R6J8G2_9ACTN|nr:hypothetical protein [Actinoplanes brasiliensis]TDO31447.1 hypothetical protein C8E87_6871 [Actinoplanes brasiliensis]GID30843.1 hypothetical protein Abr02nite_58260 [Actinoplanes brasiliensis]
MSDPDKSRHVTIMIADGRKQWRVTGPLEQELAAHRCQTATTEKQTLDAALEQLSSHSTIDVVIVNLLYPAENDGPPNQEPLGLAVVNAARDRERAVGNGKRTTLVVALRQPSTAYPDLDREARDAGADHVLEWSDLGPRSRYGGLKELAKWIHDELTRNDLIAPLPELSRDDEPGILTALSDIGEANVSLLITDLAATVAEVKSARLTYVTPGASGAHVLRAELTLADDTLRTWLLKFAKDAAELKTELINSQNVAGAYTTQLVVEYLPYGPASHGGWHAIAMVFASGAKTMRTWLCETSATDHVSDVFHQLFLDGGLATLYRNATRPAKEQRHGNHPVPAVEGLMLPPHRRLRVRTAIAELEGLMRESRAVELTVAPDIVSTIEGFVRSGEIAGRAVDHRHGVLEVVPQHADLHGGNILVLMARHPRPCVIDLAAYGRQHWALDVARLVVDIVMHCLDPAPESHFWDRWSVWRAAVARTSLFEPAADDPDNPAAIEALRWVAAHKDDLLPLLTDVKQWEWHVAVAEQLLRYACRHRLSTPKRLLGLVAAYDQLHLAQSALPNVPSSF